MDEVDGMEEQFAPDLLVDRTWWMINARLWAEELGWGLPGWRAEEG